MQKRSKRTVSTRLIQTLPNSKGRDSHARAPSYDDLLVGELVPTSETPAMAAPTRRNDDELPNGEEVLAELGVLLRVDGDWSSVIEQLLRDLESSASNTQRALLLQRVAGVMLHELGDPEQALDALLEAYEDDPVEAPIFILEQLTSAQGRWTDLIEAAKKSFAAAVSPDLKRRIAGHLAEWSKFINVGSDGTLTESTANAPPKRLAQSPFDPSRVKPAPHEKAWRARATYLKRQAELERDPIRQSRALTKFANLLMTHNEDAQATAKYFERAAKLFPGNGVAWRGLHQLAIWDGKPKHAEFYLEQWALNVMSEEKADALVELAHYRLVARGKLIEARQAYELALRVDPGSVRAAEAMAQIYVDEKRWDVASSLCNTILREARKSGDPAKLIPILDMSARVASELGERTQAVTLFAEALELDPSSLSFQKRLLDACVAVSDDPTSLKSVRVTIKRLAQTSWNTQPDILVTTGAILLGMGEQSTAYAALTQALELAPAHAGAFRVLANDAIRRQDWEAAAQWKEQLAHAFEGNDDDRFRLLTEAGDLWLRRVGDRHSALRVYESALAVRPQDLNLLQAMRTLYEDFERWDHVVTMLHTLSVLEPEPARKADYLYAMAHIIDEKLSDSFWAAQLYEQVLEFAPNRLDAFEHVGRIYTERKDWPFLAQAYRAMISRIDTSRDPHLAYALCHQLGLIYRDRMGDIPRALDVFTVASDLQPDNTEAQKIVAELLISTERIDAAIDRIRATLRKHPFAPEPYRDLYALHMREGAYDKAWCTVEVLSLWGPLAEDEREFLLAHAPVSASDIPSSLTAEAWKAHLPHADLDVRLSQILEAILPAFIRVNPSHPALLGPPLAMINSPAAKRVKSAFRDASDVLSLPMPELYPNPDPGPLLLPVLATTPALLVKLDAVEGTTHAMLNFLATKHTTEQRPEFRARGILKTSTEVRRLLLAAARISTGGEFREGEFEGKLASSMDKNEHAELREAVRNATDAGAMFNSKQWLQHVDLTGMRAGLLVCGSIITAKRAMLFEERNPDDLSARAWLQDLAGFAVGERHAELRRAIGTAVASKQ